MTMPELIGLVGPEGAGKTTFAAQLDNRYGYFKRTFAQPRRRMLRAIGMDEEAMYGRPRHEALPSWGGRTPQQLLDSLREWGLKECGGEFWSSMLLADACNSLRRGGRVVVDDVVSDAEAHAVMRAGGILVRIDDGTAWDAPALTAPIHHVVLAHPREFVCLTHASFNIRW